MSLTKQKAMCRVCLMHQLPKTLSVFSTLEGISILDAIENISNLKDIRFDNFTKIVCQPCADNVIIAYKTKIQCLLSDATLRSTVKCEDSKKIVDSETEFEDEQQLEVLDEDEQMELEELYEKQYEQKLVIEAIDENEEVELESMVEEDNTEPDENEKFLYDEHFVDENELPLDKSGEVDESEEEEYGEEEYVEEYLGDITTGSKTVRGPNQNSMYLRSCCQCLEMFEDEAEVIAHFAATHAERIKHHIKLLPPDAKRKQCVLCHTLVRHIQTHRRRKHFKDYQCRVDEGGIKTFECETCGIRFATQNKLNNHIKYNHSKTANLRSQIQEITVCPICKLATKSACNLDKHLLEMHPDSKSIECKVCNKKLKLATSLKKHMMIHFSERTFNCDMCDEKYLYSCDLERHKLKHSKSSGKEITASRRAIKVERDDLQNGSEEALNPDGVVKTENTEDDIIIDSRYVPEEDDGDEEVDKKPPIPIPKRLKMESTRLASMHFCCKCKNSYDNEEELAAHFTETHPNKVRVQYDDVVTNLEDKTQCTLCMGFVKDMDRHRRRQHQPPAPKIDHQCITCGKIFRTHNAMKECERKHLGIPKERLQCPKCPATLSSKSNLSEHIKLHTEIYRFECHLCGKKCKKSSNLKVHLQSTHSDERNVRCEICGKTMKKKSSLAIHMRIHTGDRPYKCSFCSNTYMHRTDWKRHEMVHTGYRPYKCQYCDRGFIKKSAQVEHEKNHVVTMQ